LLFANSYYDWQCQATLEEVLAEVTAGATAVATVGFTVVVMVATTTLFLFILEAATIDGVLGAITDQRMEAVGAIALAGLFRLCLLYS